MKLGNDNAQIMIDAVKRMIEMFEERLPELVEAYLRERERGSKRHPKPHMESDDDE